MNPVELLRLALERTDSTGLHFDKPSENYTLEGAVWRFLHVWNRNHRIGPDHAVALRQIARWQEQSLFVGTLPPAFAEYGSVTDVEVTPAGNLRAKPFTPAWLSSDGISEIKGIDSIPVKRRLNEAITAEPYLNSLSCSEWLSQAQKEAAWLVLTAPPASTTLIALPTGSGKSLCFQILSRFGSGLTIVVVPTIALAIDQWRSAKEVLKDIPDLKPQYFAADDKFLDPATVASDIREGRTRLVFTSPEACVSGRLRNVLDEMARRHQLENLIIDEAHIIDNWGAYFRVDFQMLATLRQNWLAMSEMSLRTFLFSATFTPRTRDVLRQLFAPGSEWREFVSQRLRPEMSYYSHKFTSANARDEAVRECAWHLPRPAIFYTTEVAEAKRFARSLTEEGFSHVGCFHGETPASERRSLLNRWRQDDIDIMVATSAFGLGVDKQDVRAVVHACMPENPHRYYQEVGRGGRDGASSICLLLPTRRDIEVAKGLTPKLLSEEVVQKRWASMWDDREVVSEDDHVWKLNTGSRRTELLGQRTYNENVRWNKRLILQLLRAGLLEIRDIEYRAEEEGIAPSEWVTVKVKFPPAAYDVGQRIALQREAEMEIAGEGLKQMQAYLDGERSICKILRRLYKSGQHVCGGCKDCRVEGRSFDACPKLDFEVQSTSLPACKVVINCPNPLSKKGVVSFKQLLRTMVRHKQLSRFACDPAHYETIMSVFASAFSSNDDLRYRLDSLRDDAPFDVQPHETIVFFHLDKLNQRSLDFKRGKEIVHLIAEDVSYLDANKRYPNEALGCRFYAGPEYWG